MTYIIAPAPSRRTMPTAAPVVSNPRARYLRTFLQVAIPALIAVPTLLAEAGVNPRDVPIVGGILAGVVVVATVLARVMALPSVEAVLRRYAPWLAAGVQPAPVTWAVNQTINTGTGIPVVTPKLPATQAPAPEPPTPPAAA